MAYSFKSEYTLQPQTPLINFQYKYSDSSLRATEVKPKLDEFLSAQDGFKEKCQKSWIIKDGNPALKYKMHFTVIEDSAKDINSPQDQELNYVPLGAGEYSIFYGNERWNREAPKNVHATYRVTRMEITCFIPELLEFIDKHICTFFIVTNFGRMQGKGFGSFIVREKAEKKEIGDGTTEIPLPDKEEIASELMKHYGAEHCYSFDGGKDGSRAFSRIKTIYSLIKSGINEWSSVKKNKIKIYKARYSVIGCKKIRRYKRSLLVDYMHEVYKTGNEKAFIKEQLFTPPAIEQKPKQENEGGFKYVRALLGISDHIDFVDYERNADGDHINGRRTSIKISNREIQRFSSPIFFKVIDGRVYMIAKKLLPEIIGKTFIFFNRDTKSPKELKTPSSAEKEKHGIRKTFLEDLLSYCIERLNKDMPVNSSGTEVLDGTSMFEFFTETRDLEIETHTKKEV